MGTSGEQIIIYIYYKIKYICITENISEYLDVLKFRDRDIFNT